MLVLLNIYVSQTFLSICSSESNHNIDIHVVDSFWAMVSINTGINSFVSLPSDSVDLCIAGSACISIYNE